MSQTPNAVGCLTPKKASTLARPRSKSRLGGPCIYAMSAPANYMKARRWCSVERSTTWSTT
jgi:hypothetical protein